MLKLKPIRTQKRCTTDFIIIKLEKDVGQTLEKLGEALRKIICIYRKYGSIENIICHIFKDQNIKGGSPLKISKS